MKCRSAGRIASEETTSSNRETNEEEALTKLVNNVSSFNGRTRMKHTMAIELAVDKQDCAIHCNYIENYEEKCTPRSVFT
jgi:hypothetical protein